MTSQHERGAGALGWAGRPAGSARIETALVVTGLFLTYVCIQPTSGPSYDGQVMISVARNLVEHGSLTVVVDPLGINTPYSFYGIGFTLMVAPFVALGNLFGRQDMILPWMANPFVLAATAGVIVQIGAELGWRARTGVLAALAFGLLTIAPDQSRDAFSEPGVALFAMLAVWGCLRWRRGARLGALLVGIGVGGAALFRTDSILLVGLVVVLLPLFVPWRRLLAERGNLAQLAIPVAMSFGWLGWYNALRYGSPFDSGLHARSVDLGFSTPLLSGLDQLLRWPGHGFFWFNPLLLLALPGLVFLWRRQRAVAVTVILLSVARLVLMAMWFAPGGGAVWGPRLLFPTCALLVLPFGELLDHAPRFSTCARRTVFLAASVLALAAAALTWVSIAVDHQRFWQPVLEGLPSAAASRRLGRSEVVWSASQIPEHFRLLLDGTNPLALRHFANGPSPLAGVAVFGAVTCIGAAWFAARRRDAVPRSRPGADEVLRPTSRVR